MSKNRDFSPEKKALEINLDDSIYGTFAEIGAGQEVARHFFQAGRASHTIAKSISAYDMTFSDEIYGKESRYVCEARLEKMLRHEYGLLEERLTAKRGDTTRFFAFANTVATFSNDDGPPRSHGWMGIRFQQRPGGPVNEIIIHVKLWDRFRLQQQETLGILGVNLIHMAFLPPKLARDRIAALVDALSVRRVEVNLIRFRGPDLDYLDNRLLSLELVKQNLTEAVLFDAQSHVQHVGDFLYGKPVLVQRGTYRPITSSNLEISQKVLEQFRAHPMTQGIEPKVLFEITMNSLGGEAGQVDDEDFLHRVDTLNALGQLVIVSNFKLFYQVKAFLRQYTDRAIGVVVGAALLPKMFDESFYDVLPGGIMEGMSRLFDDRTRVFVFPMKTDLVCQTASVFNPGPKLTHLYKHLVANEWIGDILDCDSLDTSVHSSAVRDMLTRRDPRWMTLVPAAVREIIKERQLFGYRP